MKSEAQRIAIAEACGWVNKPSEFDFCGERGVVDNWSLWDNSGNLIADGLPDYLNDLNACHEMEKVLTSTQLPTYIIILSHNMGDWVKATCATAAQRAEAFLKTIGKWEARAASDVKTKEDAHE